MPRLNTLGQACAGFQGNGPISVNGIEIGRGNGAGWLNANEVGCQSAGPPYRLIAIHKDTKAVRNLEPTAIGANFMDFGGGQWQAALAGASPNKGVRGSNFARIEAGAIGATGLDGTQVVCPNQQAGKDLFYPLSGQTFATAGLGQVQVFSTTRVLWSGAGGGFHYRGLPFDGCPLAETWIGQPRAALAPDGTWWLSYITQRRWLLQRMTPGPAMGHVLQATPGTYRPDLLILNGQLIAVAASNEAESPGSLIWKRIALTASVVPLASSTPPGPDPEPNPEPPMPIPNHLDVVKAARAKYASLSGPARAGAIVNQVAWDLRGEGAGTYYKPAGDNFNARSLDVIIYQHRDGDPAGKGATFDILGDAEGNANPQWSRTSPTGYGDSDKWRNATDPGGSQPPDPPPPDPNNTKARLEDVQRQLAGALEDLNGVINDL